MLRKPVPTGVVIGAFNAQRVRRTLSITASGSGVPVRAMTSTPASCKSQLILTPVASTHFRAASANSGPVPSPVINASHAFCKGNMSDCAPLGPTERIPDRHKFYCPLQRMAEGAERVKLELVKRNPFVFSSLLAPSPSPLASVPCSNRLCDPQLSIRRNRRQPFMQ